jgi:hypothetical protein
MADRGARGRAARQRRALWGRDTGFCCPCEMLQSGGVEATTPTVVVHFQHVLVSYGVVRYWYGGRYWLGQWTSFSLRWGSRARWANRHKQTMGATKTKLVVCRISRHRPHRIISCRRTSVVHWYPVRPLSSLDRSSCASITTTHRKPERCHEPSTRILCCVPTVRQPQPESTWRSCGARLERPGCCTADAILLRRVRSNTAEISRDPCAYTGMHRDRLQSSITFTGRGFASYLRPVTHKTGTPQPAAHLPHVSASMVAGSSGQESCPPAVVADGGKDGGSTFEMSSFPSYGHEDEGKRVSTPGGRRNFIDDPGWILGSPRQQEIA